MEQHRKRLNDLRAQAQLGGGEKRIAAQHAKGKLTARERIDLLMDPGSFEELGMLVKHRSTNFGLEKQQFLGDGVVTGFGQVNGKCQRRHQGNDQGNNTHHGISCWNSVDLSGAEYNQLYLRVKQCVPHPHRFVRLECTAIPYGR